MVFPGTIRVPCVIFWHVFQFTCVCMFASTAGHRQDNVNLRGFGWQAESNPLRPACAGMWYPFPHERAARRPGAGAYYNLAKQCKACTRCARIAVGARTCRPGCKYLISPCGLRCAVNRRPSSSLRFHFAKVRTTHCAGWNRAAYDTKQRALGGAAICPCPPAC